MLKIARIAIKKNAAFSDCIVVFGVKPYIVANFFFDNEFLFIFDNEFLFIFDNEFDEFYEFSLPCVDRNP